MSRGSGKKMLGLSRFRAYRSAIVLTRTAPFVLCFYSPGSVNSSEASSVPV